MEERMRNEFTLNSKFRDYVNKYCKKHEITIDEAMEHKLIRQVYLDYTEV